MEKESHTTTNSVDGLHTKCQSDSHHRILFSLVFFLWIRSVKMTDRIRIHTCTGYRMRNGWFEKSKKWEEMHTKKKKRKRIEIERIEIWFDCSFFNFWSFFNFQISGFFLSDVLFQFLVLFQFSNFPPFLTPLPAFTFLSLAHLVLSYPSFCRILMHFRMRWSLASATLGHVYSLLVGFFLGSVEIITNTGDVFTSRRLDLSLPVKYTLLPD